MDLKNRETLPRGKTYPTLGRLRNAYALMQLVHIAIIVPLQGTIFVFNEHFDRP